MTTSDSLAKRANTSADGRPFVPVDVLVTVFRSGGLDDIVAWRMEMDSNGVRHVTLASRVHSPDPPDDRRESNGTS